MAKSLHYESRGGSQLLSHSRLSCFRDCPRKHYIKYELGIRSDTESVPLRVGSAFHAALEAADKGLDIEATIDARLEDDYEAAMVAAMFYHHQAQWAADPLEVIASEQEFNLPLINPDTGSQTQVWRFGGKLDRIVRLPDGRVALEEYKTTSRDFAPGADYWLRLHMDSQLSLYVIAARAIGYDVETVLYDVTRRPQSRPLRATPEDKRKYKKDGALYANQRDRDERPEEFVVRVADDISSRPEHYFARIEIARLDQDLDECAAELWQQQQTMREAQKSGRWYRNPNSCVGNFNCEYLPICMNSDLNMNTPAGFVRSSEIHPELSGDGQGAA